MRCVGRVTSSGSHIYSLTDFRSVRGLDTSLVLDLGRPLHLSDAAVQFLDEPVETWFRETFKPSQEELHAFIHRLSPLAAESAYVGSTLPQLMLEAGQLSELVALALASTGLPETSELEKYEVELHRLQFALKASLRQKQYVDAVKLALKAGGLTAADDLNRTQFRPIPILRHSASIPSVFRSSCPGGRSVRVGWVRIMRTRLVYCLAARRLPEMRAVASDGL